MDSTGSVGSDLGRTCFQPYLFFGRVENLDMHTKQTTTETPLTLNRAEAARFMGVSVVTLDRMRDAGVVEWFQLYPSGPWCYSRDQLTEAIRRRAGIEAEQ